WQLPQAVAVVLRLVSQPSASTWLQSAQPVAQVIWHIEATQAGAPFCDGHALPQAPQLATLGGVSTPQPVPSVLPSESAQPGAQAPSHTPPVQLGCGTLLREHGRAQAPQLFGSPSSDTSQPSICLLPLQSAYPGRQAPLHTPAPHETAIRLFGEHTVVGPAQ